MAVQVDGDGQHPASEIQKLIQVIRNNEADLVIGSRYVEKSESEKSLTRFIGKFILCRVISFVIGRKIADVSSGFRGANKKVIAALANRYSRDYPEPESLVYLSHKRYRIKEVSVTMNQRYTGLSTINLPKGIYYVIKVFVITFIDMFEEKFLSTESEPS